MLTNFKYLVTNNLQNNFKKISFFLYLFLFLSKCQIKYSNFVDKILNICTPKPKKKKIIFNIFKHLSN